MKITMYGLSTCPHCKNTLKFLENAEVDFEVIWIDELSGEERQNILNFIKDITGNYSVPLCLKGEKWVLGYNEEKLRELIK